MELSLNDAINYGVKFHQAGDLDMAGKIYDEILASFPDHIDLLHLKGVIANQRGRYSEAIELIQKAITLIPNSSASNPAFSSFYQNLANAFFQNNEPAKAKDAYKNALSLQPNNVDARFNLSKLLRDEKEYVQAIEQLDVLLQLMPTYSNALIEKAKIYFELKNFESARLFFEKKLAVDSFDYEANMGLAKCCVELGQYISAKEVFDKCTTLGGKVHEPYFWLGFLCSKDGRDDEASAMYQQCLQKMPNFVPALVNLANIYKQTKQLQNAISLLSRAVATEPDNYEANFCLGATFVDQNNMDKAAKYLRVAISIKASSAALLALAKTLERKGDKLEAKAILEGICAKEPMNLESLSCLVALKMDIFEHDGLDDLKDKLVNLAEENGGIGLNPFDICTKFQFISAIKRKEYLQNYCHRAYDGIRNTHNGRYDFSGCPKNQRLKVGFLSADYKDQATMHLACGMFEYFDKSEFEVYALALAFDEESYHYKRVKNSAEHFVNLRDLPYLEVADKIFECGIDILVDLNSHSNGAMMEALALKPAPVQITYLYHPNTSGADFMDYCLVDEVVAPLDDDEFFSEKLLYLPNCYQVNDGKQPVSERVFTKTGLGFDEDDFVFCCFNVSWKIEPDIFECWMRILNKMPMSKLWLLTSNQVACQNIKKKALELGVDESRVVFAVNMAKDEHLARLKLADLFLDTRPYNAHTTASDALYVGVPLLTLKGDSFASRVAESLLKNVGLEGLVAKDLNEYENMALNLASSKEEMKKNIEIFCEKIPPLASCLILWGL